MRSYGGTYDVECCGEILVRGRTRAESVAIAPEATTALRDPRDSQVRTLARTRGRYANTVLLDKIEMVRHTIGPRGQHTRGYNTDHTFDYKVLCDHRLLVSCGQAGDERKPTGAPVATAGVFANQIHHTCMYTMHRTGPMPIHA